MKAVGDALLIIFTVLAFIHGMTHATNPHDFGGGWMGGIATVLVISKIFEDW